MSARLPIPLPSPLPIGFALLGRTVIVAPASRAALRAVAALTAETHADAPERQLRVLLALAGPRVEIVTDGDDRRTEAASATVLPILSPEAQLAMISALVAQATGLEPEACAAPARPPAAEQLAPPPAPGDEPHV